MGFSSGVDASPGTGGLERIRRVLWILLLISLPITSFPHLAPIDIFGETVVRPLAAYPLLLLLLLDLVPLLLRGGPIPRIALPLVAFIGVALGISLLNLAYPVPPLRGQTPPLRSLRAFATLLLGVGFFFVTVNRNRRRADLARSFRALYLAFAIAFAWALAQAGTIFFGWPEYSRMNEIQRMFSIRDMHTVRVTGFAYEPSWFAHQLAVLMLPLLLAGLLSGYKVFGRGRWARIGEGLLFVAGVAVLGLTYSRGGALSFVLAAGLISLGWLIARRKDVLRWFSGQGGDARAFGPRYAVVTARVIALGAVLIAAGVSLGWILSRYDYFTLLWTRIDRIDNLTGYIASVGAGPRLALAQAGWEVFKERPWIGVGLGQSGFYMLDRIPNWAMDRSPEIARMLSPTSLTFPNPKNLWVRLLAETGLVGTIFFIVFLLMILLAALYLAAKRDTLARFVGLAGAIGGMAAIFEGFSLDSFALPTMWITLGIVTTSLIAIQVPEQEGEG